MKFTPQVLFSITFLAPFAAVAGNVILPEPKGPYVTGVHDFEFTDTEYPTPREKDGGSRRIMVRAWYPACPRDNFDVSSAFCTTTTETGQVTSVNLGRRRQYFEAGERSAIADPEAAALAPLFDITPVLDEIDETVTNSYLDAPVLEVKEAMPVVVFSHGGLSYVSQNTALCEEIASQGFMVLSMTHPGDSSGILYPNGDKDQVDGSYLNDVFMGTAWDPEGLNSFDIAKRYEARKAMLVDSADTGLPQYIPRRRDDLLALIDFLEDISAEEGTAVFRSGVTDPFVMDIAANSDLESVIYTGMSYGGAAAGSAAHADPRAIAAINFDGTHLNADLLDTAIRVPYLTLIAEPAVDMGVGYSNEFHFEPLESMGQDPEVTRIRVLNSTHFEFSDIAFAPAEYRMPIAGGGKIDGSWLHEAIVSYCMGFIEAVVEGKMWSPDNHLEEFPGTELFDVSYVAEWAKTSLPEEEPSIEDGAGAQGIQLTVIGLAAFVLGAAWL